MTVRFLPRFQKQYLKLPPKIQSQFQQRLALFLIDSTSLQLRVHPLKGRFVGYWSLNVTGDFRALFYYEDRIAVVFALIGTHSQLYG